MFSLFKKSDEEKVVAESKFFTLIAAIFTTVLVVSNIIAGKIADFGNGYFLSAAVIFFPISYIISDILTEVYGFAAARRVLWTGFLCNLLAVVAIAIAIHLAPAPFFADQEAYAKILGFSGRLLAASFIAYLVGGFTNSFIMAKMKVWLQGKKLWLRTITSTIVGEGIDTVLFTSIAFAGIFAGAQIGQVIFYEWIAKSLFEIVLTPVTYAVIRFLKKAEGIDHYDRDTDFRPFSF